MLLPFANKIADFGHRTLFIIITKCIAVVPTVGPAAPKACLYKKYIKNIAYELKFLFLDLLV